MSAQPGTIVWNELNTHDVESARSFYSKVFGWEFSTDNPQNYTVALKDGKMVAGLFDLSAGEETKAAPPSWLTYVETDDIKAACEAALAAGGTCLRPAFHVDGVGMIGIILDNTGACLALMQSDDPT
ncbi:MAG: VOC family protein [Rhodobacteraceae bacterium]|nr:VOC family protein [Paracoccaceae bacterium]